MQNPTESSPPGETTQLQRDIKKAVSSKYKFGALDSKGFGQPLGRIKGQLGEFEKSMEAANARVIAFGASAGAIYALSAALRETVTATLQVEKSLAEIKFSKKHLTLFSPVKFSKCILVRIKLINLKKKPTVLLEKINNSIDVDHRLYKEDIQVSIAHCQMLIKKKIYSILDLEK